MVLRQVRRQALVAIFAVAALSGALGCAVALGQGTARTAKPPLPAARAAGVESLAGAATPVSKTAVLNASGVAYTPFTVNPTASNPTTGKTGSATATAGWGPSTPTATDCSR